MAELVESVVVRFTADGPEAEVTLRNTTAALAGGRVLANNWLRGPDTGAICDRLSGLPAA